MTYPSEISEINLKTATGRPLPRGPILDWSSFKVVDAPGIPSVEDLLHTAFTTSGRAAIYQALLQLQLPLNCTVLVPSYHCPTMVAPVILAKLNVAYFGIDSDGLPNLDAIDEETASKSKAMLVTHYFGLARSLAKVRQWCDARGIALIEDCAHCYFGQAGERAVGAWGDFSTASLSKFLPVSEGGLLASAHRQIPSLQLTRRSAKAQLKGWVDILELSTQYKRLAGLNKVLSPLFHLKTPRHQQQEAPPEALTTPSATTMMDNCDMGRIGHAPLWSSMVLKSILPRGRIISQRQKNFACYAKHLDKLQGAKPLYPLMTASFSRTAPYVFPLWVKDADRIYHALRAQDLPVFRWDRIWPGTPNLAGDVGPDWSLHVLQLLCHQDLDEADIVRTVNAIQLLLAKS